MGAQGKKCLFVGAVGDNFYVTGVTNNGWRDQWSNIYEYHSGIGFAPVPSPPNPGPSPPFHPDQSSNPLGIVPLPKRSDNFFLLIGDWGAPLARSWSSGDCQRKVADKMKDYVRRY